MPLTPGSRLGPYEVLAAIGAGGMGEVYRARDAKLNRDVAIKVLPPAFAQDSERLTRLQREAQVLASLNHPNIAHIHGFEESGGSLALVMELVDGETLAGPKPLDEVIAIARQIAEALEYAHDKGIVHRDLKPANIKITSDGVVKVLDFGLAKAMEDSPAANADNSPTLSIAATKAGFILGTAAYMSPEQARGKAADRRSDIFSYGVVLLELITGQKTFEGEMITDVLAAVIRDQPAVPAGLPPHIAKLLRRCLEKDPKRRLQAIGEARIMLDEAPEEAPSSVAGPEVRVPARRPVAWMAATAVLTVALAGAGLIAWRATRPAPLRPLQRFEVDLGAETLYLTRPGSDVNLSPDGTRLVTYGRGADGQTRASGFGVLYTRLMDQTQSVPLSGTESAWDTFFSPDGQWLAFFSRSDSKLKKISVQGGAAVTLCDARLGFGGSWGEDGNIIASLDGTGLWRVPSAGGAPQAVTQLDKASQEVSQRFPQVLPGAQAVLFTSHTATSNFDEATIAVQDLKTGRRVTLVRGGYYGRYVPSGHGSGSGSGSGHLLYVHQATLFAAPMSLARLELTGPAAPVLEGVRNYNGGGADISFSRSGTLAFLGGGTSGGPQRAMVWLDKTGKTEPIRTALANYFNPRLSPDGKRLAIVIGAGANSDVYSYEWTRDTMQRLTFTPGINAQPAWAPDGKHFAFISNRGGGPTNIYWMRADGAGEAQRLTESKNNQTFPTVAPDGKRLAFVEQNPEGRLEIWTLPLDLSDPDHPKPGKPEVFLRTAFNETAPAFSPDGRWMAYQSSESGSTQQVYVRSFPGPGGKWQVSGSEEGLSPAWLRNGREVIYRARDTRIMVAAYTGRGEAFLADKPRPWSDKSFRTDVGLMFDPTPDGKRIAVVALPDTGGQQAASRVTFLLNFFDELQRKAPGKN